MYRLINYYQNIKIHNISPHNNNNNNNNSNNINNNNKI